jgi:putative membrane protein
MMDWNIFGWWGGMTIMMFIGLAFMVLFWGGIILLIVWAIRQISSPRREAGPPSGSQTRPLDITRERYARGEITKEQYEQIRKDLES